MTHLKNAHQESMSLGCFDITMDFSSFMNSIISVQTLKSLNPQYKCLGVAYFMVLYTLFFQVIINIQIITIHFKELVLSLDQNGPKLLFVYIYSFIFSWLLFSLNYCFVVTLGFSSIVNVFVSILSQRSQTNILVWSGFV